MTERELRRIIRALAQEQRRAEDLADRLETDIARGLRANQAYTYERLRKLMEDAPDFRSMQRDERIRWWVSNKAAVDKALLDSGYARTVNRYVDQLPEFEKFSTAMLKAQGIDFSGLPKEIIDHVKRTTRSRFMELGARANAEVSDIFMQSVLGGRYKSGALERLRESITGKYKWGQGYGRYEWHATTYARTAHSKAMREFSGAQAEELGLDQFIPIGPLDSKTRAFCQRIMLAVKVYTRQEIDELDNGTTLNDVFTDFGGWNCRHSWATASKELVEAIQKSNDAGGFDEEMRRQAVERKAGFSPLDMSDPKGWSPAKSIAEAEQWALDNGIAGKVSYEGLHISAVNEINRVLGIFVREFPAARKQLQFVGTTTARNNGIVEYYLAKNEKLPKVLRKTALLRNSRAPAASVNLRETGFAGIAFNPEPFGELAKIEAFFERYRLAILEGTIVPGEDTMMGVITHEFGHILDYAKSLRIKGVFREIEGALTRDRPIELVLSHYGAYKYAERFSEAFAEYLLSENPREFARAWAEKMLSYYKKGVFR